jgi:type VI secretion system secreted protein Hcp
MAAVDYFLKIDGVDGESTDARHRGEIEIQSFSWGATQSGGFAGGGGGGAGKASFSSFTIVKRVDKASPLLFLACATGKHLRFAVLNAQRSSPNVAFLQIQFTDILISSFKDAGTEGEVPLEEVSFNFTKIEYRYVPILPTGQLGQPIETSFDLRTNTSS